MKRLLVSGLFFAVLARSPSTHAADPDPWWGRDKALHFSISVGLGAGGYAGSTYWFDERWQRAAAGAGFSLTLGASKELIDLSAGGDPSWRDFTWDVAGTALGVLLAWFTDVALFGPSSSQRADGQSVGSTHSPARRPDWWGSPVLP